MENKLQAQYNEYFHKANLSYWIKEKDLYEDIPNQNLYPRQPWLFWIKSSLCRALIDAQSRLVLNNPVKTKHIINKIFEKLSNWNVLIITNHATFAWYPILIDYLTKEAEKRDIESFQDKIYTILWPLLLTNKPQRNVILSFSNCLKTIPQSLLKSTTLTKEFEWFLWKVTKGFLIQLKKLIKTKWNIFIISPTWTRDLVIRNGASGDAEKISFENDWWIYPSIRLLQLIANQWVDIVFAWINDAWLKNPIHVHEKNNQWTYSDIIVDLSYYNNEQFQWLINEWIVMESLAALIFDKNWINIWSTMPSDKLKIAKQLQKEAKFQATDNSYFNTLKRRTIRKLFQLLH